LVIKGQLRVYILSEEGKEITLYRLNENEVCILSASCILKNITFSIYVDAVTDVEILKISASAFKEVKNK
ncbi:cyclic nucleotide-binding domain-containing protein, partial [Acinetobacter sp. 163]|nr:cyclic nucleotide-binding domain-containing protein [Acinetobacter sp. 163]